MKYYDQLLLTYTFHNYIFYHQMKFFGFFFRNKSINVFFHGNFHYLKRYMIGKHLEYAESSVEEAFKSIHCDMTHKTEVKLIKHQISHVETGSSLFCCKTCNKWFKKPNELNNEKIFSGNIWMDYVQKGWAFCLMSIVYDFFNFSCEGGENFEKKNQ